MTEYTIDRYKILKDKLIYYRQMQDPIDLKMARTN